MLYLKLAAFYEFDINEIYITIYYGMAVLESRLGRRIITI